MKPQFIDLQVNGYAGVDFNSDRLSPEMLNAACVQLQKDGVSAILATIITAESETMQQRLQRLVRFRRKDELAQKIIRGIHLEGPFLNPQPGFYGAHSRAAIRPANPEVMKRLLDAADGLIQLVTLAPEMDSAFTVTRFLAEQKLVVAAGHCDPDLETLRNAAAAGLSMFTHLGNGCPANLQRHDNIIMRALALKDNLRLCFIADGIHIPFFVLRNYLTVAGYDRTIIVSDAMAAAAAPPGNYTLAHLNVEIGADRIVREAGKSHFAGSAVSMQQSYDNLLQHLGCSAAEARKMMFENPLKVIE